MSGIDRADQMLSYYTTPRKAIRWYLKIILPYVGRMSMECEMDLSKGLVQEDILSELQRRRH